MDVTVGTFNLNNLFSRFNFRAEIDEMAKPDPDVEVDTTLYSFGPDDVIALRTFKGKLVKAKPPNEQQAIAKRIKAMNADVLAVQEVEDVSALRVFNDEYLGGLYPYVTLVEGNDPRLIDVALLSKLPVGAVTTWQHVTHPDEPNDRVFSRDLLEAQILDPQRRRVLLTVFNTHLKSQFVEGGDPQGTIRADARRRRQAETIARIVEARMRPDSRFVVTGDMNDTPAAATLAPFAASPTLDLVDGLAAPQETRPAKPDNPPPPGPAWTHRFKEGGQPAAYELFDQIWLSQALAAKQSGAWIERRTKHAGDGSDHDPAWVRLGIQ